MRTVNRTDTDVPQFSAEYCLSSETNFEEAKIALEEKGQAIITGQDAKKVSRDLYLKSGTSIRDMLTSPNNAYVSKMESLTDDELYLWIEPLMY